jgi:histidinol-phosphate aminotransferase
VPTRTDPRGPAASEPAEDVTAQPARPQPGPPDPGQTALAAQARALADLPLRDDLRGRVPYGAPQSGQAGIGTPVMLNVNENPHAPSARLVADLAAAVGEAAATLHRYPDREARALRTDLAAYLSARTGVVLDAERVWAANGSNEVLQQVCQAFGGPGRVALGFEPSYSMHPLLAAATSTGWVAERRAADFTLDEATAVAAVRRHRPSIVFLTTPNNPTGTPTSLAVVDAVCAASEGVVVVDEAYAEFADTPSAVTLLEQHPRLVVSRTMSKAFALAGARVGYLAASPAVVDALRLVRLPYHLSALTQAAARTALAHADELLGTVAAVVEQRDRMVRELGALGLQVVPTAANFLLFGPFDAPAVTWQALLDRGVLVRDVSSGPGLAGWLRVNAGTEPETSRFLAAVADVLRPAGAAPA